MSDTDESNLKTVDDAVNLSEVEYAENSLNVNKTSDKKRDPLFKDTCTDNESDSVNVKKRYISDNENSDEETFHPNKKYKSCANAEQNAEIQEVNKESDVVLSSVISSNIIEVSDSNKAEYDTTLYVPIQLENTPNLIETLPEEKNNEQKSQGNDTTEITKFDSDTDVVNNENSKSKNVNLESVNAKILKHIETTVVVVRCELMNFEKYFLKKSSNTETNSSSSEYNETNNKEFEAKKLTKRSHKSSNSEGENLKTKKKLPKKQKIESNTETNSSSSESEETSNKKTKAKKLTKRKINNKSSDSGGKNVKAKKNLPKKQKMKIENSNVEFMDSNDVSVTINKSNSKISEQEISKLINTDSNDEKLNKGVTSDESDNDSGINITKIQKKNLSNDSVNKLKSLQKSESENSNSNVSDNESESHTKTENLPEKSTDKKSLDSESDNSISDSDNESKSRDKKVHKKSTKVSEKKANSKKLTKTAVQITSKNDIESEINSRKDDSDSDSEEFGKENKKSSGSDSEKEDNSDKENYKSSSSESKSRTKKFSKKSVSNNDETDSDSEGDVDDKSDIDDQTKKNFITQKNEMDSNKKSESKRTSERRIERLKKFLRTAGIHVNNFGKLFENIKTIKGKERKLLGLLEENGLEGRPTIKKCKELRKKNDIAKEIAELDTSNIITKDGRTKRAALFSQRQQRSPTPDPKYQQTFNRIRMLVDSDSD